MHVFFLKIRFLGTAVKGVYRKDGFSLMTKVDSGVMETLITDSIKNHFLFSGVRMPHLFMFFLCFFMFLSEEKLQFCHR